MWYVLRTSHICVPDPCVSVLLERGKVGGNTTQGKLNGDPPYVPGVDTIEELISGTSFAFLLNHVCILGRLRGRFW